MRRIARLIGDSRTTLRNSFSDTSSACRIPPDFYSYDGGASCAPAPHEGLGVAASV